MCLSLLKARSGGRREFDDFVWVVGFPQAKVKRSRDAASFPWRRGRLPRVKIGVLDSATVSF